MNYYNNMREIVKNGYENGQYEHFFRENRNITNMENKFLQIIVKNKIKNNKILDLGCGIGIPYDKYFVDNLFDLYGIDITEKHILRAKQNVPKATFILGDFSKFDFSKEKYYSVISLYSIFHIPRIEHTELFQQVYNSLENNGYFLVNFSVNDREYKEKINFCNSEKMAWSYYDINTNIKILQKIGFKIELMENEKDFDSPEDIVWLLLKK